MVFGVNQTRQHLGTGEKNRKMTRPNTTEKEGRRHNSGFAKKRVQWLIEHSTSHQLLWYVDSFELRNPLLRKAAKRYRAWLDEPNGKIDGVKLKDN